MVGAAIRWNKAPSAKWYLINSLYTTCGFGIKRWFWDTFSANLLLPLSTPKTKDVHRLIRWFPYNRQYFSWTSNISKRDIEYNGWCTIRILLLQLCKSRVWSHQCLSTRKISCSLNWFIYWSIYYTSMATNNTEMLLGWSVKEKKTPYSDRLPKNLNTG